MTRARKLTKSQLTRLTRLPPLPGFVLEGGRRTLATSVRAGDRMLQPQMALWLDAAEGTIRASTILDPGKSADGGLDETLRAMVDAITNPVSLPAVTLDAEVRSTARSRKRLTRLEPSQPGLPEQVRTNDAALAEKARALLDPLGVRVEYLPALPVFEAAMDALSEYLGTEADGQPPEPFTWEIDPALTPPLFKAAAGFWRRAPWEYMPDMPPVAVTLGKNGPQPDVETLYASILGGGGHVFGVAMYYTSEGLQTSIAQGEELSLDDDEADMLISMLRQSGIPIPDMPPEEMRDFADEMLQMTISVEARKSGQPPAELLQDTLVTFFDPADETDPTYLDWLHQHQIKPPSRAGVPSFLRTTQTGEVRPPDAREARALTLALEGRSISSSAAR